MLERNEEYGFNILIEKIEPEYEGEPDQVGKPKKQRNEPIKNNAEIMQSILFYSIGYGTECYFKSKELSENHLLKNCNYYKELYRNSRTNYQSRPANIDDTVVKLLSKLEYLDLVYSDPFEPKTKRVPKEYKFTKLGRMIGLLLSCYNDKTVNNSKFEITYSGINQYYESLNTTHSKFLLIFFKFCKKEKMYGEAILFRMINILLKAPNNKEYFLNQINFLDVLYRNSLQMWNIFKNSLSELRQTNNKDYEMFTYNFKLAIESVHEYKCKNKSVFEMDRYQQLKDIEQVVIEGRCNQCSEYLNGSMNIWKYLEDHVISYVSKAYVSNTLCEKCNNGYLDFQIIT
jgi:hypothetical protein